jgi:MtN3 and saliva related transmembrane protein
MSIRRGTAHGAGGCIRLSGRPAAASLPASETAMELASLVGLGATLASTTSFLPQAWKVIRTRDTAAISAGMYAVTVAGFALWLTYGLLLGALPLIVTNAICLALSGFILVMKLLPRQQKVAVAEALDPSG